MIDHKCKDCGTELNEGEAKCFTVCDHCWNNAYLAFPKSAPESTGKSLRIVIEELQKRIEDLESRAVGLNAISKYEAYYAICARIAKHGRANIEAEVAKLHPTCPTCEVQKP